MTRTLLLAIGLTIAGSAIAGSTTGSIGARLIIYSRCEINQTNAQTTPQVDCGRHLSAQPRITQSEIKQDAKQKETGRLVTIEW
ncbi:hypothetical protein O3W44_09400 [Pantoea sp. LMR881]|uniref:hypothetical protein n=1 Tax=Pantoea sp. LMR881 TaxID=3014336 RepID=UPI0022AEBCED|nr:hypothetical protein [Pantoea sp. LMR881]MCZ4059246.1 hypothetical protein [Pantoea sp. LMR881]